MVISLVDSEIFHAVKMGT